MVIVVVTGRDGNFPLTMRGCSGRRPSYCDYYDIRACQAHSPACGANRPRELILGHRHRNHDDLSDIGWKADSENLLLGADFHRRRR